MGTHRVTVIGAGTMVCGIAQVAAQAGFETTMYDAAPAALTPAGDEIRRSLGIMVDKGKITPADRDAVLARIHPVKDLPEAVREASLVIEAIPESMELKKRLFTELDRLAPRAAILATKTSSLSIDEIASPTTRPEQVIGLHFSNPVPVMTSLEVIRGILTSDDTLAASLAFGARIGKEPVMARDFPGFIGNRLLLAYINEAFQVLMDGVGTAEDIDKLMTLALRHPMGPLELANPEPEGDDAWP